MRRGSRIIGVVRPLATVGGWLALLGTLFAVMALPNNFITVQLAALATLLLAFDRRLGPLPAAMLVMLAVPVGRGAEVGLPRFGDYPYRPQDVAAIVGVALSLPGLVRGLRRPALLIGPAGLPLLVFAGIGLVALAIGVAGDNAFRDIVRDARWWSLYGVGLVALLAGVRRNAIVRALVWGMTLYAAVLVLAMLMPMLHGGLKWYAYSYDPRMRLHYGQAIFLLPALALMVRTSLSRPTPLRLATAAILAAAVGLTLTRTLLVGLGIVTVAVIAWTWWQWWRRGGGSALRRRVAIRVAAAGLAVAVGVGAGFATYLAGTSIWAPADVVPVTGRGLTPSEAPEDRPVRPSLDRLFASEGGSTVEAQAVGRLDSYVIAFSDSSQAPILGQGLGQQARVSWAWGGFRAIEENVQPGVDNAYLTVGLKTGGIGIAAFAVMVLWPLRWFLAAPRRRMWSWYVPAWLGVLGLTLLQSFAVSGYAPFTLSLLIVLPVLAGSGSRAWRASHDAT